jgi:glycosyltransferase involved in cell wall biosynthesis
MLPLKTIPGTVSVVIPACNEALSLDLLLAKIRGKLPESEVIVVNDGSTDNTPEVCRKHDVTVINHPYNMGNGAAVKTGARTATGDILLFMDADGQHDPENITSLLEMLAEGYDMVVGSRNTASQAGIGRMGANYVYNTFASWIVNQTIADLTSGYRAVRAEKFREFLHLLPNGFSYPTTITMSFFRAGYAVGYVPITANKRIGKSHINPIRDGVRFFLIIFKIGTLYSPLKMFLPFSLLFFLTGLIYYAYTFATDNRFTNMSALLLSVSVLIFLIGLVSEQITMLLYSRRSE